MQHQLKYSLNLSSDFFSISIIKVIDFCKSLHFQSFSSFVGMVLAYPFKKYDASMFYVPDNSALGSQSTYVFTKSDHGSDSLLQISWIFSVCFGRLMTCKGLSFRRFVCHKIHDINDAKDDKEDDEKE